MGLQFQRVMGIIKIYLKFSNKHKDKFDWIINQAPAHWTQTQDAAHFQECEWISLWHWVYQPMTHSSIFLYTYAFTATQIHWLADILVSVFCSKALKGTSTDVQASNSKREPALPISQTTFWSLCLNVWNYRILQQEVEKFHWENKWRIKCMTFV